MSEKFYAILAFAIGIFALSLPFWFPHQEPAFTARDVNDCTGFVMTHTLAVETIGECTERIAAKRGHYVWVFGVL